VVRIQEIKMREDVIKCDNCGKEMYRQKAKGSQLEYIDPAKVGAISTQIESISIKREKEWEIVHYGVAGDFCSKECILNFFTGFIGRL